MVKRWVSEFTNGRRSTNEEPRSEPPVEVKTKIVENIREVILEDGRLKVSRNRDDCKNIKKACNIVHYILHMMEVPTFKQKF